MSSSKPARKSTASNHRSTLSLQRTEVTIHIYDLLPPGKVSTVLWAIGSSLLHSGVVVGDKEFAYGGHDRHNLTGVYWTPPGQVPPGGTFRHALLHGFSFRPPEELDAIIQEASQAFQGTSYNLLTKNCNHFTSYLCERLTGRPAPGWLNRAASIGVALPCVVPREWIAPPEYDTADGELLDEDVADERASMLGHNRQRERLQNGTGEAGREEEGHVAGSSRGGQGGAGGYARHPPRELAPRLVKVTDADNSDRAEVPKHVK